MNDLGNEESVEKTEEIEKPIEETIEETRELLEERERLNNLIKEAENKVDETVEEMKKGEDSYDISEDFFLNNNTVKPKKNNFDDAEIDKSENKVEFGIKGKNIKIDKYYNIKLTIGAELFSNLSDFLTGINLDVVFRIFSDRVRLYTVDAATTHRAHVDIGKIEFAEYEFVDIDNVGDGEYNIYVDLSILEDLLIIKDYPLDIYIDLRKEKKVYFVCGNDIRWRRLHSMSNENVVLSTFKNEENSLNKIMTRRDYQRVVMSYKAMSETLSSLIKKENKGKDSSGIVSFVATRDRVGYTVEDDLKGGEYWNYGENIIVYPIDNCKVDLRIEYIKIFNKLKFDNQVKLLVNEKLPLILEARMGGGNIITYFMIAPRIEDNKQ